MNTHADQGQAPKGNAIANEAHQLKRSGESINSFENNRPEAIAQRKVQEIVDNSPQVKQAVQLKAIANNSATQQQQSILKEENKTGLPDQLKTGLENLSGYAMDDVKVHRNSDKPAQLQAHAYAQGTDIHLAPGQEKHLPHEAWHVVQQKQGRVRPTVQLKGQVNVNDDVGLEKEADVMGAKALLQLVADRGTLPTKKSPEKVSSATVQRIIDLNVLAKLLTTNKNLKALSDGQKDNALYWNTRHKYDELKDGDLVAAILNYANRGFEDEVDEGGRLPGQTNPQLDLPDFMQDHHEFDIPLPLGIGALSFRHGHQYVLGSDNNKWISNNVTWEGISEQGKFRYLIHVILLFKNKVDGVWDVDPHVTIRSEQEQLKQTGVAFVSEQRAKTKAKKDNPEMEATRASYSLGLGKSKRKPGSNMGAIPDGYIDDVFRPWLVLVKNRAVRLNQVEEDGGIENRRLWLELKPQYANILGRQ